MGGIDKALMPLSGRPMVAHVLARLTPQVVAVAVNVNGEQSSYRTLGCQLIADANQDFAGPLAGVLAGLRWAAMLPQRPSHLVTVAVDLPLLPVDLVEQLAAGQKSKQPAIVVARSAGSLHPVCALLPLSLADDLAGALIDGCCKVREWQQRHPVVIVDFPLIEAGDSTIDPFFNINTPADLADAEAILKSLSR